MQSDIDCKLLLIKYMAGVVCAEGVFFEPLEPTEEEMNAFKSLEDEAGNLYVQWRNR